MKKHPHTATRTSCCRCCPAAAATGALEEVIPGLLGRRAPAFPGRGRSGRKNVTVAAAAGTGTAEERFREVSKGDDNAGN